MGLFRDDGFRDPLYEDDETLLIAGKHGYVLSADNNSRRRKQYGPLKEEEMLDLLDELHVPNRRRIEKAIHEHAHEYPRYRSERTKLRELKDKQEPKGKGGGCGCFFWLIVLVGILYFIASNQQISL